jgi:hypothetical protein
MCKRQDPTNARAYFHYSRLTRRLQFQKRIFASGTNYLGQFHLAPIIIPEGERVVDVINATLIASADDCFPNLKPRETPSQLPANEIASEKEVDQNCQHGLGLCTRIKLKSTALGYFSL